MPINNPFKLPRRISKVERDLSQDNVARRNQLLRAIAFERTRKLDIELPNDGYSFLVNYDFAHPVGFGDLSHILPRILPISDMSIFAVHQDYQFIIELYDGSDFVLLPQNVLTLTKRQIEGFRARVSHFTGSELNGGTATLQVTITGAGSV